MDCFKASTGNWGLNCVFDSSDLNKIDQCWKLSLFLLYKLLNQCHILKDNCNRCIHKICISRSQLKSYTNLNMVQVQWDMGQLIWMGFILSADNSKSSKNLSQGCTYRRWISDVWLQCSHCQVFKYTLFIWGKNARDKFWCWNSTAQVAALWDQVCPAVLAVVRIRVGFWCALEHGVRVERSG